MAKQRANQGRGNLQRCSQKKYLNNRVNYRYDKVPLSGEAKQLAYSYSRFFRKEEISSKDGPSGCHLLPLHQLQPRSAQQAGRPQHTQGAQHSPRAELSSAAVPELPSWAPALQLLPAAGWDPDGQHLVPAAPPALPTSHTQLFPHCPVLALIFAGLHEAENGSGCNRAGCKLGSEEQAQAQSRRSCRLAFSARAVAVQASSEQPAWESGGPAGASWAAEPH